MNIGYRMTRIVTPATTMALVTLEQAKVALGIDPGDTSQDARLTQQIASVSRAISNYCGRTFPVQVYRDQLRGACGWTGEPLVTRQYPIVVDEAGVPLVSVSEEGATLDPAYVEVYPEVGSVYRLDSSMGPGAWGAALLVVDYTAGYEPIPEDVQGACLEWLTARWYAVGQDPALRSETIPDLITQTYNSNSGGDTTSGAAMPMAVSDMLAPYRIWRVL